MTTRCKLYCSEKSQSYPGQAAQIKLGALYPGETGVKAEDYENKMFGLSTPSATFTMTIANTAAAAQFETGKFYYIDISEVPADRQKP